MLASGEVPAYHILYADSNLLMQQVIKKAFDNSRCKVDVVDCTDGIIDYAQETSYTCLLLDMKTDHFEDAADRIRSHPDPMVHSLLIFGKLSQ